VKHSYLGKLIFRRRFNLHSRKCSALERKGCVILTRNSILGNDSRVQTENARNKYSADQEGNRSEGAQEEARHEEAGKGQEESRISHGQRRRVR